MAAIQALVPLKLANSSSSQHGKGTQFCCAWKVLHRNRGSLRPCSPSQQAVKGPRPLCSGDGDTSSAQSDMIRGKVSEDPTAPVKKPSQTEAADTTESLPAAPPQRHEGGESQGVRGSKIECTDDGVGGWSEPQEIDEAWTDTFKHAGIPEILAGFILAIGIGVFGYSMLFKNSGRQAVLQRSATVMIAKTSDVPEEQADSAREAQNGRVPSNPSRSSKDHSNGLRQRSDTDDAHSRPKSAAKEEVEDRAASSGTGLPGPGDAHQSTDEKGSAADEAHFGQSSGDEVDVLSFQSILRPLAKAMGNSEEPEPSGQSVEPTGSRQALPHEAVKQGSVGKVEGLVKGGGADASAGGGLLGGPFSFPAPISRGARQRSVLVKVATAVDPAQAQAFEFLQAVKVIEEEADPAGICTRREYARWLVATSNTLSRTLSARVLPAMYMEGSTELAFDDVPPSDPDFSSIQGLAEAGVIDSQLSRSDLECARNSAGTAHGCGPGSATKFEPNSPLSRQDLVSWKVSLEQRTLPSPDTEAVRQSSGFIDVDRIDRDALPALAFDLQAGERSIVGSTFGFTRRFDPQKPVTRAQAASALVGESSEVVLEEMARVEAERIADAAVEAAVAAEDAEREAEEAAERVRRELADEAGKRQAAERELERVQAQRRDEIEAIVRERMQAERAPLQTEAELGEAQLARLRGLVDMQTEKIRRLGDAEPRQLAPSSSPAPGEGALRTEAASKQRAQLLLAPTQPSPAPSSALPVPSPAHTQQRLRIAKRRIQDPHLQVSSPLPPRADGHEHEHQSTDERFWQRMNELRKEVVRQLAVAMVTVGRWLAPLARRGRRLASVAAVEGGHLLRRGALKAREVANAAAMAAIKGALFTAGFLIKLASNVKDKVVAWAAQTSRS